MKTITHDQLTPEIAAAGCFVTGMTNEQYHAYPAISNSGLTLIDISPADFAYAEPRETTRAMEIGTAIHAALLEPAAFAIDYLLLRDVADRRCSEYKQAIASHSKAHVLTGKEADKITGMMASVSINNEATELLSRKGHSELSAFVMCPVNEVLMKCRFDRITHDFEVIDIKKTQDSRYESFQRSIAKYRYHVQDAFYSYVFECITGTPLASFRFLAIEENSPHKNKLYEMDDESKQVGHRIAMRNLATYAECERNGDYPYPDGSNELMCLPAWALDEIAESKAFGDMNQ